MEVSIEALAPPFNMLISGVTSSGKTSFIFKLIRHVDEMIAPKQERIIYCYGQYQERFRDCQDPRVSFVDHLPDMSVFEGNKTQTLLIIDDLQLTETDNPNIAKLFTIGSHHLALNICFMAQQLFNKAKFQRLISLNSQYFVLFANPRDKSEIMNLAKQTHPGQTKFVLDAYKDATSVPYGYLLLDFKQRTDDRLRLRTCIFPGELQVVYIPENVNSHQKKRSSVKIIK